MKKNAGLLIICAAGFCLRLYNLDKINLWWDEICNAARVSKPLAGMLKDVEWTPFPPFYYLVLKLWTKISGSSVLALRLPSVIFSVLMIFFIFKLAEEIYDERVAFFSAALLCISPYSINYAQEAKMYPLLWLLGLVSFLYLYRFIKRNSLWDLAGYLAFAVCAIYTMYAGFIFIVIHNIIFFCFSGRKKIKPWLIGQAIILLSFLPWLHRLLYHIAHREEYLSWIKDQSWSSKVYHGSAISALAWASGAAFGPDLRINRIDLYIYLFFAASAVIIWKNMAAGKGVICFRREEGVLLLWLGSPILVLYFIDLWVYPISEVVRYIGFIHIPFIILLSKGISNYEFKLSRLNLKFIVFFVLLLSLVSNHLYPYYRYGLKLSRDNLVECFKWVGKNADSGSLVLHRSIPPLIMQYYYSKYGTKPPGQTGDGRRHRSVFLFFYFRGKENAERLAQEESKRMQLPVSGALYPSSGEVVSPGAPQGGMGVIWFKKKANP